MAERSGGRDGCGQQVIVVGCLLWFGLAPTLSTLLVDRLLRGMVNPRAMDVLAILVPDLALLVPFASLARLAGGRAGSRGFAATAMALTIASGLVVLDAAIRVVFPQNDLPIRLPRRYAVAAIRLVVLVPYAALVAWMALRLAGGSGRSIRDWLGLGRPRWTTVLVTLGAAALVTLPWPLTGALGDGPTSVALAVQMLLAVIPQLFIFWGVVFLLLNRAFSRTGVAAAATILIYTLSVLGGFLPQADWRVLSRSLFLLPMAFLLTEMRARGRSILPLLPLALCYPGLPLLFVDPRDVVVQGIPEIQHIVSYLFAGLTAALLGLLLYLGRRAAARRRKRAALTRRGVGVALAAVVAWALWGGFYQFLGTPRLFNDGFLIILAQQADLGPAYDIAERYARLTYVYETLVETAERTQRPLRDELDDLGVPYRPHYVINMIRVDGHRRLMARFEGRP